MNRLWCTDGLSRKQYEERKVMLPHLDMVESDFPVLMGRALDMMRHVRFYNQENQPDGYFYDLFRFQPLLILTEIQRFDTYSGERFFRQAYGMSRDMCRDLTRQMKTMLDEWDKRLAYCRDLQLTKDLRGRPLVSGNSETTKENIKKDYYSLLETVRKLQQSYNRYLKEILESGRNDPALAVLVVFLQNYGEIVQRFNVRWADLPSYYFEQILHAKCRKPEPDKTWLELKKSPGGREVIVEKGTSFVAGKNNDTTLFCYRSDEEVAVGDVEVGKIYSYFLEKDTGRFPAARLNYVTAILRNIIELGEPEPQELFGGINSWHEPVGLLVESPMFVLREGNRNVEISFCLTQESIAVFAQLVRDVDLSGEMTESEVIYKLLNDAFYLEISTEEGWVKIPDYLLTYEEHRFFRLVFRLNEHFSPTGICRKETHGRVSENPVLRIMMNREAWLFPYSWARQVKFDEMTLRVEVSRISSLNIYNASGQLDTSVPTCPFGSQPERGAWFVFGNYEMALKPLVQVAIACQWQQLPENAEGLFGYYRGYRAGIDNHSFRVRTGWLTGKKWHFIGQNRQYLFTPFDGRPLYKNNPLPEKSRLVCRITERMPAPVAGEERYVYGRSRSGFIRVVLDEPEMGFGHTTYRQIFTDTMLLNSRLKRPLPLPVVPVTPVVDDWELEYVAEEKVYFAAGQVVEGTKLYHVCPLAASDYFSAAPDKPVALAEGPQDSGNLLLGFKNAVGVDRFRFFIDVAPLRLEIDERDEVGKVEWSLESWYFNRGSCWERLDSDAVLQDTTGFFSNNGVIEVMLPESVVANWLDGDGVFWLCAVFPPEMILRPALKGIYMNAVEVVSDTEHIREHPECVAGLPMGTISTSEENLPGITSIRQIVTGSGGRIGGEVADIRLHLSDRIAHRGRAVLPADYERLILEHFPLVMKVKCLPGLDSKSSARSGVVTLVIVPAPVESGYPLATGQLLSEIEDWLLHLVGMSPLVDAINPVYEEMTVRCRVLLEAGVPQGETVRRLEKKLNGCIAPWLETDGIPVFGYRFSLRSLQNVIMEDSGVALLQGLSVLHVTEQKNRLYQLEEYRTSGENDGMIGASQPWCIAVPASGHLIEVGRREDWKVESGVGELEIGKTLVIG